MQNFLSKLEYRRFGCDWIFSPRTKMNTRSYRYRYRTVCSFRRRNNRLHAWADDRHAGGQLREGDQPATDHLHRARRGWPHVRHGLRAPGHAGHWQLPARPADGHVLGHLPQVGLASFKQCFGSGSALFDGIRRKAFSTGPVLFFPRLLRTFVVVRSRQNIFCPGHFLWPTLRKSVFRFLYFFIILPVFLSLSYFSFWLSFVISLSQCLNSLSFVFIDSFTFFLS